MDSAKEGEAAMAGEDENADSLSACPVSKHFSEMDACDLLERCHDAIQAVSDDLEDAAELARKAGLSVSSTLEQTSHQDGTLVGTTTAGHSNTDHIIVWTGDRTEDRIAELKRNLQTRTRAQQLECKGEDRWDKPRIPGERRRRIVREKDYPEAPSEAPLSGYVIFVAQMTTKIRHDRPTERHDQTRVVQEISKIWRIALTDADRKYYSDFADQARKEYRKQILEYRATGTFVPSETFERLGGVGPWVRKKWEEKNALEKELSSYETVVFPPRPPEFDEEYKKREEESKLKRKRKLQMQAALLEAKGCLKRRKRKKAPETSDSANDGSDRDDSKLETDAGCDAAEDADLGSETNPSDGGVHLRDAGVESLEEGNDDVGGGFDCVGGTDDAKASSTEEIANQNGSDEQ